jgi:branched-chain amino acid transport system substrate-binding protein
MASSRSSKLAGAVIAAALLGVTACSSAPSASAPASASVPASTSAAASSSAPGSASAPSGDPIAVGVIAPLSGPYAAPGTDILGAAQVVADNVNSAGGVLGRPLQVVSADDQCNAQIATQAAEKLIAQKVVAVVGGYCSSAALPIVSLLDRAGSIPFVAAGPASAALTQQGTGNVFRTTATDSSQGPLIGSFLISLMQKPKIAIVNDQTTFATGLANYLRDYVTANGGEVVYFDSLTPGQQDYSSTMTRIGSSGAQAFVYTGYYPECASLATSHKKQGLSENLLFMCGGGAYDPGYLAGAGDAANDTYVIFTPNVGDLSGPQVEKFTTDYKNKFSRDPGGDSVFEADSMNVAVEAIKAANSATPADITKALAGTNYQGMTGEIKFDSSGERELVPMVMYVVRDGKYTLYARLTGPNTWTKV